MAFIKNGTLVKPPLLRKDYEEININIFQEDGITPRNITTDTLVFEARLKSSDAIPVLKKSSSIAGQVIKTDPLQGKATVVINKEDLLFAQKGLTLKCFFEVTDASGRPNTTLFDIEVTYRA